MKSTSGAACPAAPDPTGRAIPRVAADASPVPPLERYAQAIISSITESLARHGIPVSGKVLEIEPGRACYADTGIYLSRVVNIKTETVPLPRRFVEFHTTEMFLLDTHLERNRWQHNHGYQGSAARTHAS